MHSSLYIHYSINDAIKQVRNYGKKKETYFEDALWDNSRSAKNSLDGKNSGGSETPGHLLTKFERFGALILCLAL